MTKERTSLAEAFKPTQTEKARGASLEGLLPPKRKRPEPTSDTGTSKELPAAPRPTAEPDQKSKTTRAKASDRVPGAVRNVGVYLPPGLLEPVKEAVRNSQTTYADLLVDAFDVIEESALERAFEPEIQSSATGMPRRVRRPRGTAGIQIQLRLNDQQIQWLDKKVRILGAPSRSALVSTAYKIYLETATRQ